MFEQSENQAIINLILIFLSPLLLPSFSFCWVYYLCLPDKRSWWVNCLFFHDREGGHASLAPYTPLLSFLVLMSLKIFDPCIVETAMNQTHLQWFFD